MKITLRRTTGVITALALSLALTACGSDSDDSADDGANDGSTPDQTSSMNAGEQTFGDSCSAVPTSGPGSFDGMVKDPVATAASNNPLLSTLVAAVGAIDGLADTLNGSEALTVFAPTDDAFAAIPKADLDAMVADGQKMGEDSDLYKVLAHHVLGENADPAAVAGEKTTLAGDTLTVKGDADSGMTVTDGTVTANVLCGNIPTANATVYVIDKVLTGVK